MGGWVRPSGRRHGARCPPLAPWRHGPISVSGRDRWCPAESGCQGGQGGQEKRVPGAGEARPRHFATAPGRLARTAGHARARPDLAGPNSRRVQRHVDALGLGRHDPAGDGEVAHAEPLALLGQGKGVAHFLPVVQELVWRCRETGPSATGTAGSRQTASRPCRAGPRRHGAAYPPGSGPGPAGACSRRASPTLPGGRGGTASLTLRTTSPWSRSARAKRTAGSFSRPWSGWRRSSKRRSQKKRGNTMVVDPLRR
jgi:hypothetical protein